MTPQPDCVAHRRRVIDAKPGVVLVSARTDFIDDAGEMLRPDQGTARHRGAAAGQWAVKRVVRSGTNPIGLPVAAMFRRADFDRCGGFRRRLAFPIELDLWVRLIRPASSSGSPRLSRRSGSELARSRR